MSEKIKLRAIPIPWRLGRYGIGIETFESKSLAVKTVGVDFSEKEHALIIRFDSIAALQFFNFNFEEQHYGDYETMTAHGELFDNLGQSDKSYINYWRETGICYDSYFYIVENTKWFTDKDGLSDLEKRGFRHFLIEGYGSYLEVLAEKYEIAEV